MAVFKLSDVIERLQSMADDGFEYAEIDVVDDDQDNEPACLCVEALYDECTSEGEMIDAVTLPSGYHSPNS